MSVLSWFRKKPAEEDYEQVLASLALSIQKRQTKLSEIRLRERRATLLVTTWAFAGWVAYVGLWWAGVLGRRRGRELWGLPVILGPVIILFTRRILQLWYARKGNAEEKTLKTLLVQQRNKIEEIKKKTNYYSTKNLLERYDDGPGRRTNPEEGGPQKRGTPVPIKSPGTPNRPTAGGGQLRTPQTPVQGSPQEQPFSPTIPTLPPPRKQWYDKLADAILGDDTASTGPSPASRYALICERCFTHNGLVKEAQWEHAQYVCPKCGHFNSSLRSRKVGANLPLSSVSPQSAQTQSGVQSPTSAARSEHSQSASAPDSQFTSTHREPSPKTPLSASTVLVERHDVEHEDGRQDKAEHEHDPVGEAGVDTTAHMDVDS